MALCLGLGIGTLPRSHAVGLSLWSRGNRCYMVFTGTVLRQNPCFGHIADTDHSSNLAGTGILRSRRGQCRVYVPPYGYTTGMLCFVLHYRRDAVAPVRGVQQAQPGQIRSRVVRCFRYRIYSLGGIGNNAQSCVYELDLSQRRAGYSRNMLCFHCYNGAMPACRGIQKSY